MVRLREIPRAAAFAWAPGSANLLLVTGTRAGAVAADFSDETAIELWDLKLDDQEQSLELQPIHRLTTDSSFYDITWGPASPEHPRGIIAGALENGSLDLWDAEKLLQGASDAHLSRTSKHTGAIKALQFSPLRPQLLATAGVKGELFIYDVNDISNPFRLGSAAARADDLECVAWNRKVAHILATGGSGGQVTVWDLKTKKASLTLNNNRKAVSAIAWDPNNSTKLVTATSDDTTPVILLWDLRNSSTPEKTLSGHEQGVLSLAWCQQDSDLLLSSGKDNRTILWNPQAGTQYGELPEVTNWTFSTKFHPDNPNLTATASFDGKVTVQTLQNTNQVTTQTAAQDNLDGEDFFAKAQAQPAGASFTLQKAPVWLERPVGASFGFGGRLVIFKKRAVTPSQPRSSIVKLDKFSVDSDIVSATEAFEAALKENKTKELCAARLEGAKSEAEKVDWKVIETLVSFNPREGVVEYLGFTKEEETNGASEEKSDADAPAEKEVIEPIENGVSEVENGAKNESAAEQDVTSDVATPADDKKKRLSQVFDGDDDDDFLTGVDARQNSQSAGAFHILSDGNTGLEDRVTKALILGDFGKAVDICLKEGRIADAFIIANCGGKELVEKVQTAYLASKSGSPSYLRLLSSVIENDLSDVVRHADLSNWKETMVLLCTFAKPTAFPDLCEMLGDRLSEDETNKNASFCYLVGGKLEKVVAIWIKELEETESATSAESEADSTFSIHARSLQHFIEKVTIFRQVSKYNDPALADAADWQLAALYDKYTEYADVVAGLGLLTVAQKYLDLVPLKYSAAEAVRSRVMNATKVRAQPQPKAAARPQATSTRSAMAPRAQAAIGLQPTQAMGTAATVAPTPSQATMANPYAAPTQSFAPIAPVAPNGVSNPYAPAASSFMQQPSGYGNPVAGYAPPNAAYAPPSKYGQPQASAPPLGGPPRNSTPSTNPPLLRVKEVGDWNDVPLVAKPPPRKNTPRAAPITAPFNVGQVSPGPPPSAGSYGMQRSVATPPPPPPKAGPPRMMSPPVAPPPATGMPSQATPAALNPYAPPPSALASPAMITVPRTQSPYNAPPSGIPPPSRYTPAAPQLQQQQPPAAQPMQPPPMNRPPPMTSYAPPAQQQTMGGQYAPAAAQYAGRAPVGPPPQGPPMSEATQPGPPPASKPTPPPTKARHPAGDRSHIPPNAQQMVNILSSDMQRVAAQAPASFVPRVNDTSKRLNLLFDHLNNEELVQPETIEQLSQLANALEAKDYDLAHRIQVDIHENKTDECGQWMVGVKRLISMSKASS